MKPVLQSDSQMCFEWWTVMELCGTGFKALDTKTVLTIMCWFGSFHVIWCQLFKIEYHQSNFFFIDSISYSHFDNNSHMLFRLTDLQNKHTLQV